ncbi:MAG TPA: hypothetical protein VI819_00140 [Patescibacteria group bacterium]|nr:hypothetical protein [Patescibacteria group bacterium]
MTYENKFNNPDYIHRQITIINEELVFPHRVVTEAEVVKAELKLKEQIRMGEKWRQLRKEMSGEPQGPEFGNN